MYKYNFSLFIVLSLLIGLLFSEDECTAQCEQFPKLMRDEWSGIKKDYFASGLSDENVVSTLRTIHNYFVITRTELDPTLGSGISSELALDIYSTWYSILEDIFSNNSVSAIQLNNLLTQGSIFSGKEPQWYERFDEERLFSKLDIVSELYFFETYTYASTNTRMDNFENIFYLWQKEMVNNQNTYANANEFWHCLAIGVKKIIWALICNRQYEMASILANGV